MEESAIFNLLLTGSGRDIFDKHVVPKLKGNDVKFLYDVNRESRAAIQRSGVRLPDAFEIGEFNTESTISWALERCSERRERFCEQMARNGNVELLRFFHENGCPWDEKTCSQAAFNGHLECLRYAHENGCPWDEKTCSWATENGRLECYTRTRTDVLGIIGLVYVLPKMVTSSV